MTLDCSPYMLYVFSPKIQVCDKLPEGKIYVL